MACKHYGCVLGENHRHYVICERLNNCVLCVAEQEGPMIYDKMCRVSWGFQNARVPNRKGSIKEIQKKDEATEVKT